MQNNNTPLGSFLSKLADAKGTSVNEVLETIVIPHQEIIRTLQSQEQYTVQLPVKEMLEVISGMMKQSNKVPTSYYGVTVDDWVNKYNLFKFVGLPTEFLLFRFILCNLAANPAFAIQEYNLEEEAKKLNAARGFGEIPFKFNDLAAEYGIICSLHITAARVLERNGNKYHNWGSSMVSAINYNVDNFNRNMTLLRALISEVEKNKAEGKPGLDYNLYQKTLEVDDLLDDERNQLCYVLSDLGRLTNSTGLSTNIYNSLNHRGETASFMTSICVARDAMAGRLNWELISPILPAFDALENSSRLRYVTDHHTFVFTAVTRYGLPSLASTNPEAVKTPEAYLTHAAEWLTSKATNDETGQAYEFSTYVLK